MAPSRSTPQMMQVTRAAFQAFASLNKQATDPKSHTLVSNFYTGIFPAPLPAIPMVDPAAFPLGITAWLFNKLVPKIHQTDEGSLAKYSALDDNATERVKLGGVRGMLRCGTQRK